VEDRGVETFGDGDRRQVNLFDGVSQHDRPMELPRVDVPYLKPMTIIPIKPRKINFNSNDQGYIKI
jgi:hypothetical protein